MSYITIGNDTTIDEDEVSTPDRLIGTLKHLLTKTWVTKEMALSVIRQYQDLQGVVKKVEKHSSKLCNPDIKYLCSIGKMWKDRRIYFSHKEILGHLKITARISQSCSVYFDLGKRGFVKNSAGSFNCIEKEFLESITNHS